MSTSRRRCSIPTNSRKRPPSSKPSTSRGRTNCRSCRTICSPSRQQLNSGKLNQQAQADLQLQGQRKQRDAQRISDDLQAEFDRDRQDILGKAAQKMQDVVKKLAEEKGFDIVVDVSQTLYFKPALDLTADALAAYNKAYPAK